MYVTHFSCTFSAAFLLFAAASVTIALTCWGPIFSISSHQMLAMNSPLFSTPVHPTINRKYRRWVWVLQHQHEFVAYMYKNIWWITKFTCAVSDGRQLCSPGCWEQSVDAGCRSSVVKSIWLQNKSRLLSLRLPIFQLSLALHPSYIKEFSSQPLSRWGLVCTSLCLHKPNHLLPIGCTARK